VKAFDPVAMDEARRLYAGRTGLELCADKYDTLDGADALLICTEWQQFRAPDFAEMEKRLKAKIIIDGRNLYAPARMKADGWTYLGVGRSA
jgi:UDPglucose 6-dehydrogenase